MIYTWSFTPKNIAEFAVGVYFVCGFYSLRQISQTMWRT